MNHAQTPRFRVGIALLPHTLIALALAAGTFLRTSHAAPDAAGDPEKPAPEKQAAAPLRFDRFPQYYYYSNPLTPEPEILLRFNAAVEPERAASLIFFAEGKDGRRIPAVATRPEKAEEVKEYQPFSNEGNAEPLPLDHFIRVSPLAPLPAGTEWSLEIDGNLASTDRSMRLGKGRVDNLGTLSAFTVRAVEPVNPYNEEKTIRVVFSDSPHESFTEEVLKGFVEVTPKPKNLRIELNGSAADLHGDFDYHKSYTVTVRPGVTGANRTSLDERFAKKIVFEPNSGFVTLPAFATTQNASGGQQFEIDTGNLKNLRVRVKRLSDRDLVYAMRGYDDLYEGAGDRREIPFEMVPGRTIYDQEFEPANTVDRSEKFTLDWREILGGQTEAALYVCAEGWSRTRGNFGVGAQAIVQLTDIGLAWKQFDGETLLYAFSLRTGKALPRLKFELLDGEAEPLSETQSDNQGIVRLPEERTENVKWIAAARNGDRHMIEFSEPMSYAGLWNFAIPYRYYGDDTAERRTLVFTDRPLYEPGETVHLKCVSRLTDGDALLPLSAIAGQPAKLTVRDSRNRLLVNESVALSRNGSFDHDIELPAETALGWFSVQVDFNDPKEKDNSERWRNMVYHGFQVAEYRPNTFEIAFQNESEYETGDKLAIPVSAKYYMGKPLSKAQLTWHVSARRQFPMPRGFENFVFGNAIGESSPFTDSRSVDLSDSGGATIDLELPEAGDAPAPLYVSLNAEITDINQQTVAESAGFTVHSSDFYLGVRTPEGVLRAGAEVPLSFVAANTDARAHTEPVAATMKLEKRHYNTVKMRGAGGRMTYRTEETLETVLEKPVEILTRLHPETGTPLSTLAPVTVAEGGDYYLTLTAKDAEDRPVVTRTGLRIFGADEPAWGWYDEVRIDVTPDKDRYRTGDVAKLLVRSPILGNALVTTERAGVRTVRVEKIAEHESVIEVPIGEGAAPNLFASVLILRGSEASPLRHPNADYRLGYCQLNVDDPAANLEVTLETDRDDAPYRLPGATVEVAALVRDHQRRPVEGAEVTLYAVDEGVLSLMGYDTPDPGAVFHAPFSLGVRTGQSVSDLLPENPNERDFGNKGYVIGGGGEMDGLDPARARKNFQPVAFWRGAAFTGPDGRVRVSFETPDNLTTFRVMAVVASENRFGKAERDLVINKPLIIEPALPAFGNVGDRMDLTSVLHNNTDRDLDLEIRVELDRHAEFLPAEPSFVPVALAGVESAADSSSLRARRFRLRAGETSKLGFPAQFARVGEGVWRWSVAEAGNPKLADVVESKLAIGYPVPLMHGLEQLTLTGGGKPRAAFEKIDPKLLNGRGTVRVTVSNSRLLEAADALEYLLHYPYGCVEQTTSSLLPWLTTQNMRHALPGLDKTDAEIRDAIGAGVARLLSMQTDGGGLGYWPGASEPILWGSAYGGMGLVLAKRAGAEVPDDRLSPLWDYLSKSLRNTAAVKDSNDLYNRCLAAYTLALAGRGEPGYHDILHRNRERLTPDGRSLLALAMLETAGAHPEEAIRGRVAELLAPDAKTPEFHSPWHRPVYATAAQLLAWSRFDPASKRADDLASELIGAPRTRAAFGSTYINSWAFRALAEYDSAVSRAREGAVCRVKFGDETREMRFGDEPGGQQLTFEFDGDRRAAPPTLEVDRDGARVYAHVEVETQPAGFEFEAENKGFGIERTYHRIDAEGNVEPAGVFEVGDLVLVTLHLSIPDGERVNYLAVDDPMPSIFEAVNPEFKSQAAGNREGYKGDWKRLYCHYRELRTDRALFFCDYLYKGGDYAVEYLARVVAPGEATAPPAKIEAMYEPERHGLSATTRVVAKPLQLGASGKVARADLARP
ncbi:MAG: hypothetical protein H7A53_08190 [Akkermansiaceae bacterium]|nr:hypothetical protein [Akkermansiaceae bacterium]MCP5550854.1 hypothetical protein [Akkermansiaceae bacterium]